MQATQQTTTERYGSGHEAVDAASIITDVEVVVEEKFYLDGDNCDTANEATSAYRRRVHFLIDNFHQFHDHNMVGVWMRSDNAWAEGNNGDGDKQDLKDEDGNFIFRASQSHEGPKVVLETESVKKLIEALAQAAHLKVELKTYWD